MATIEPDAPTAAEDAERARDPAADWRDRLDYQITIDLAACHYDAYGRLNLHGALHNLGREAIDFGDATRGILRIGARTLLDAEPVRPPNEARAIPPTPVLAPGKSAPFGVRLPAKPPADAAREIEVSLVSEGRFWFCDLGFPSVRLAMDGSAARNATGPAPISSNDPVDDALATVVPDRAEPGHLRAYCQARLGTDPHATLDDLWNCYRLLLDRVPDADGFEQFAARIRDGIRVGDLVEVFLGSEEFSKRAVLPDPRAMPPSKSQRLTESPNPHLGAIMADALATDQFVVDVGAGSGTFTALAAARVGPNGRVVALEPDPVRMRQLLGTVTSSGFENVDVLPFCAADGDGFVTLVRRGSIVTAREVSHDDLTSDADDVRVVYARTLDSIVPPEQRVDVVRIALDGFDHRAASGAKALLSRWRPKMFGEFAPGLLDEFSRVAPLRYLELLRECGYDDFTAISADHGAIALGDDIAKLAAMPARLGTASVEFLAT